MNTRQNEKSRVSRVIYLDMATIIHHLWEPLTMATGPTTAEKDAFLILRIIACDTAPFLLSSIALPALSYSPGYGLPFIPYNSPYTRHLTLAKLILR